MNQTDKTVLILAEREESEFGAITFELLRAGRVLADKVEAKLCVALLGHEVDDSAHEIAHFSDVVYALDNALLETFQVDFYVHALEQLCRRIGPDIVLMGHTLDNLDLAPKLAYRMGTSIVTDCIGFDIEPETGRLLCTKPVYGDSALATFLIEKKPQMVTLRPRLMENMERSSGEGEIIGFKVGLDKSIAKTELIETVLGEGVSLDKADVIVAGGRGIKRIEGLTLLKELIEVLKGYFDRVELGASRPLVDTGWAPPSRQVGLTGEKASPELYFAIGISGALQHLAGIFGSRKIVAVNNDEQATIFKYADYGVVGDYEDVIPALIKKLKELQ